MTTSRKSWLGLGMGLGALAGWLWWQRARREGPLPGSQAEERPTALVTGASSGIGTEFARLLARQGYDLILVARREERLRALAAELEDAHGIAAESLPADLGDAEALAEVEARIAALDTLTLLINNAGFGIDGEFAASDLDAEHTMIRVNVVAPVRLTHAALPGMIARGAGGILNVSSVSAFYPIAGSVDYSGAKAYLNAFTEALHQELAGTGVRVMTLCPGFTRTEFQERADVNAGRLPDFIWMSAEAVAAHGLRDLAAGHVISVPGVGNQALVAISRIMPREALYIIGRWLRDLRTLDMQKFRKRTYDGLDELLADVRFMVDHREEVHQAMELLDPAFRRRLMLAVTQVNECRYCAHHHAQVALTDGLAADEIADLLAGEFEACPSEERPALLYAEHWADTGGDPDPEAREKIVATYGAEKTQAIEIVLRMISAGNYMGNTWDSLLYRLSGGRLGLTESKAAC